LTADQLKINFNE